VGAAGVPVQCADFAPYYLLYGQQPTVPPAIRERMEEPIDFDDPEAAAADVLARAELIKRACVMAGANQRIAQHRDTLRYATVRGGSYLPKLVKFEPGDYGYVRRPERHGTLLPKARQEILRVVEVSDAGVATLQGRCGGVIKHNISNLAPCHLANIDPSMELGGWRPSADLPCEVCHYPDDEGHMVQLCDGCDTGWHTFCLNHSWQQCQMASGCAHAALQRASAQRRWRRRWSRLRDAAVEQHQETEGCCSGAASGD
jgi:hypothetical protein